MKRAILMLFILCGCREQFQDTQGMDKARELLATNPESGGQQSKTSSAPAGMDKLLTGGRKVFSDDFERDQLGDKWTSGIKKWRLKNGTVHNAGADNKGLWLLEKLPTGDVRIEFDVLSRKFVTRNREGKEKTQFSGDLKCEAFAKEPEHQKGYVFIFGGWNNSINRIARLEEHGNGPGAWVVDGPSHPVKADHNYRMKVVRMGDTVGYYADDKYLVHATDGSFINGRYFGFNNWRSQLTFDNVAIYKLNEKTTANPPPRAKSSTP